MSENRGWMYKRGTWEETEDPLVWEEGDAWETVLDRAGYEKQAEAGFSGIGSSSWDIEVYKKKDDSSYLASVCYNSSDIETIVLPDYPSLLMFLREFAPFLTLESILFELDELRTMGDKAFQAWHGHDYAMMCHFCDPVGWERDKQRKREQAEKKQ